MKVTKSACVIIALFLFSFYGSKSEAHFNFNTIEEVFEGDTTFKSPEREVPPPPGNTSSEGHALWALGVQIGYTELGAYQNVSASLLSKSLTHAYNSAALLKCLPAGLKSKILALRNKMQSTSNSKYLYNEIFSLRQEMANIVVKYCHCSGQAPTIAPPATSTNCNASDWAGTWKTTYNQVVFTLNSNGTLSGYYNTSKHYLSARPVQGNPCIIEGTWRHKSGSSNGRFRFVMVKQGEFEGQWTYSNTAPSGKSVNWKGTKQ